MNQRSCQILCGEFVFGHLAALTVHRTVIHFRSAVRCALYLRVMRNWQKTETTDPREGVVGLFLCPRRPDADGLFRKRSRKTSCLSHSGLSPINLWGNSPLRESCRGKILAGTGDTRNSKTTPAPQNSQIPANLAGSPNTCEFRQTSRSRRRFPLPPWGWENYGVIHSTMPYFTLIRSSFSSMGSAANHRKSHVAAAWTQSMGNPET